MNNPRYVQSTYFLSIKHLEGGNLAIRLISSATLYNSGWAFKYSCAF